MEEEQVVITKDFLNELVDLHMLISVKPGEIDANGHLFYLPKPCQPGQWQILSDMWHGGQNNRIGSDSTMFPLPGLILEQLYSGGWQAVVGNSKFF
jgi:hypothetical protein